MQDYLKVIWTTQEWDDSPVTSRALAERFGVSPSTVSEALKKAKQFGGFAGQIMGDLVTAVGNDVQKLAEASKPKPEQQPTPAPPYAWLIKGWG